jgi:hypothetical protein
LQGRTQEERREFLCEVLRKAAPEYLTIGEMQNAGAGASHSRIKDDMAQLIKHGTVESTTRKRNGYTAEAYRWCGPTGPRTPAAGSPASPTRSTPAGSSAADRGVFAQFLIARGAVTEALGELDALERHLSTLRGAVEVHCAIAGKNFGAVVRTELLELVREALDTVDGGAVAESQTTV